MNNDIIPYVPAVGSEVSPEEIIANAWLNSLKEYFPNISADRLLKLYESATLVQQREIDMLTMRRLVETSANVNRAIIAWMYGVYHVRFGGQALEFAEWLSGAIPAELEQIRSSFLHPSGRPSTILMAITRLFDLAIFGEKPFEEIIALIETGCDVTSGSMSYTLRETAATIEKVRKKVAIPKRVAEELDEEELEEALEEVKEKYAEGAEKAIMVYKAYEEQPRGRRSRKKFQEEQRKIRASEPSRITGDRDLVEITERSFRERAYKSVTLEDGRSFSTNTFHEVVIRFPEVSFGIAPPIKGLSDLLSQIRSFHNEEKSRTRRDPLP